ncbi:Filamentation induced by cAMP protein Fic [gamma proteobacterium HdN1]|nr:Filamentation induced by cAMP protein Fic [gamma proteobacterium HdN1]
MQVGLKALANHYGIALVQPLSVESVIGAVNSSRTLNGRVENSYQPSYQPSNDFAGHFEFGLKYEPMHLEFFARLFAAAGPEPIADWCHQSPFGQYARRAGFLYEWLTGKRLDVPDVKNAAYCDAISAKHYLVSTEPQKVKRWKINNNLPGNADFCPLVRYTAALQEALAFDLKAELNKLSQQFGADVLMRTASWLTLKESRSSFLIEKESNQTDRIQRFAQVIAKHCGRIESPLSDEGLQQLQAGILGANALGLGMRRSPVFVGQATLSAEIVHYIAPHYAALPNMLEGLRLFEETTRGADPLIRAAALAFAFVYIHPMRDGNGRIHRFLINDILLRDKAIPSGVILPISATIMSSLDFRSNYDRVLEVFSKPFMQRYAASYRFGKSTVYEDGTHSNLEFDEYEDASFAWRHPDLTEHVMYIAKVVAHTIHTEMADEARMLINFQQAQQHLKDVLEMPDQDANRIIRSIKENNWQVSNKLKKEYSVLADADIAERVVEAVRDGFASL